MSEHIYKKLELIGSSAVSSDDAIRNAIREAHKTIKHMDWFEVTESRGHIVEGDIAHWQVTIKLGFRLDGA